MQSYAERLASTACGKLTPHGNCLRSLLLPELDPIKNEILILQPISIEILNKNIFIKKCFLSHTVHSLGPTASVSRHNETCHSDTSQTGSDRFRFRFGAKPLESRTLEFLPQIFFSLAFLCSPKRSKEDAPENDDGLEGKLRCHSASLRGKRAIGIILRSV